MSSDQNPPPSDSLPPQDPSQQNPAEEGLPEWEPLTPELVEDEAIRGDFVIRWTVILLALLLGCSLINETATLVHIKSGQYLASHGFLPSRSGDPFSATASDRTWVNPSWLFDLILSGVYGASSWIGVSVLKALLSGLTFWVLSRISLPRMPTWWGSICALLALIASHPRLTATPELITLLGLTFTLALLNRWKTTGKTAPLGLLPPLFLVWGQLDNRVYLGASLLLLFGVGEFFTRRTGDTPSRGRPFLTPMIVSLVLLCVNPFPLAWINASWQMIHAVYPAYRAYSPEGAGAGIQFFPVASPEFLHNPSPAGLCGLALFAISGVTLFLNRKRLELSHLLCFFGFAVFAILSTHELAAASIVFAVLATLNGQSWYANRYSLAYTVGTRSLVFSRGGRAITVLALFAVGFFSATGRVRAPGGSAVGFGLDPDLATSITSYQTLLQESCGDKGFNFVLPQGDLLIWCGKKPFIDHRLALYLGTGPSDLITLHQGIRKALRPSSSDPQRSRASASQLPWEDLFKKYQISFAVPRLTGNNPDYGTFVALVGNPAHWTLQRIGASSALFCYGSFQDPKFLSHLRSHQQDFIGEAFRKDSNSSPAHLGWPQPPNVYQKYFWQTDRMFSSGALEGQHLMRLATSVPTAYPALPYLAIRKAQQALAVNGNDELAYIVLGEAYTYLGRFDTYRQMRPQGSNIEQMRYLQAVAAYSHALTINPENAAVHFALFGLYERARKVDLAERELAAYRALMIREVSNPDEQFQKQLKNNDTVLAKLREVIEHAQKDDAELTKKKAPAVQRAVTFAQHGCVLKALELLKDDNRTVNSNPDLMKVYGFWLLESGRTEEAYELSGQLQGMAEQSGYQDWRGLRTVALLINGEYDRAVQIWTDMEKQINRTGVNGVLETLSPKYNAEAVATWPLTQISAALNYFYLIRDQICALDLNIALTSLEKGETQNAGKLFTGILEKHPETADRATIATYLMLITNTPVDPLPPSERIPVLITPEPTKK